MGACRNIESFPHISLTMMPRSKLWPTRRIKSYNNTSNRGLIITVAMLSCFSYGLEPLIRLSVVVGKSFLFGEYHAHRTTTRVLNVDIPPQPRATFDTRPTKKLVRLKCCIYRTTTGNHSPWAHADSTFSCEIVPASCLSAKQRFCYSTSAFCVLRTLRTRVIARSVGPDRVLWGWLSRLCGTIGDRRCPCQTGDELSPWTIAGT